MVSRARRAISKPNCGWLRPRPRVTSLCSCKEKSPRESTPRMAQRLPRLRGFGSRAAPTRHPVAAGQAQTSLSAPLRALAQSLTGLGCAIRVLKTPILAIRAEMERRVFSDPRSRRRASQPESEEASLVFEPEGEAEYSWKSGGLPCRRTGAPRIGAPRVHVGYAPGELASARWGEERRKGSRAPGRAFFRLPFFARAKKGNPGCRGGATRK